jgi:hypothetical protein
MEGHCYTRPTGTLQTLSVNGNACSAKQTTAPILTGRPSFSSTLKCSTALLSGEAVFLNSRGYSVPVLHGQQVDFLAVRVAVVVEWRAQAVVLPAFQQFAQNPGFQDGPALQRFRAGPFGEVSGQAGISKKSFGLFIRRLVTLL